MNTNLFVQLSAQFCRCLRMICIIGLLYASFWGTLVPASQSSPADLTTHAMQVVVWDGLPVEAQRTISLIQAGGPYPYSRDGSRFNNFERRLPEQPRGYYREFTVPTPGKQNRGAQRIVLGAKNEYYYTADHYRTFRRIQLPDEERCHD